ncbi:hypothetical protein STAS_12013 [Striga asiatica]|uniref:Electron transporter n=1 Tax=Striga asiatica TaxID=4170 RepID=A0A5A7PSC2_STRAF|nr:hypothetical protein STAS_12013 [Striga asiatica]
MCCPRSAASSRLRWRAPWSTIGLQLVASIVGRSRLEVGYLFLLILVAIFGTPIGLFVFSKGLHLGLFRWGSDLGLLVLVQAEYSDGDWLWVSRWGGTLALGAVGSGWRRDCGGVGWSEALWLRRFSGDYDVSGYGSRRGSCVRVGLAWFPFGLMAGRFRDFSGSWVHLLLGVRAVSVAGLGLGIFLASIGRYWFVGVVVSLLFVSGVVFVRIAPVGSSATLFSWKDGELTLASVDQFPVALKAIVANLQQADCRGLKKDESFSLRKVVKTQKNRLSLKANFYSRTRFPDRVLEEEEDNSVHPTEAPHPQKFETGTKKQSSNVQVENSLRQEILTLEKRLHEQVSVRCALEKALGYKNSAHDNITNEEATIPKSATELIREISVLELEVGHLEQYLLSLYRKAFDQPISSLSPKKKMEEQFKSRIVTTPRRRRLDFSRSDSLKEKKSAKGGPFEEKFLDSSVQRSHSSLSQRGALLNRASSPPSDDLGKALRSCHSQPLSMIEYAQNSSSSHVISLAEHLGASISDHILETPNKLSEDMVRCMCTIYCKLADNRGLSSPNSSSVSSSTSAFSPKEQCGGDNDMWGPGFRVDSSFDVRLDNPFHVEGLKDFSGPYSSMVEVNCLLLYRDSQKSGDIEFLLQNFRSLVSRLGEVDPRKMMHEEKLAFWINVHNALVMHAFLAYGIPQNNMKRMFLLLKAAYNVGGQIVSADVIQSSILGCRMSRPGQWLRLLLPSKSKFKSADERQAYGIERLEPLLYFALSCGSHSDPAVRVFTPKRIYQELEAAKEDYIRATFGVRKDNKILLPKIVDSFAKDSGLCQAGVLETIEKSLPESLKKSIKKCQLAKNKKSIEWVPHNFSFRYIIMKEIAR